MKAHTPVIPAMTGQEASSSVYREALMALERKAARIHGRDIKFTDKPELMEFCSKCGHIGCKGECHA